jgi:hypothetical protein
MPDGCWRGGKEDDDMVDATTGDVLTGGSSRDGSGATDGRRRAALTSATGRPV